MNWPLFLMLIEPANPPSIEGWPEWLQWMLLAFYVAAGLAWVALAIAMIASGSSSSERSQIDYRAWFGPDDDLDGSK